MRSREEYLALCNCAQCPIAQAGNRNPVLGHGPDKASLAIVGEAPGYNEHIQGVPFVGQSGQLLNAVLNKVGLESEPTLSTRSKTFVTNACLCRPDQYNSTPEPAAIAACRPRLLAELEDRDPTILMPLGASSAQLLLNTKEKITEIQGVLQWSDDLQRWVMPAFHPAYILRSLDRYPDLEDAAQRVAQLLRGEASFPPKHPTFTYEYFPVEDAASAEVALRDLISGKYGYRLACDVETDNVNTRSQLLTIQFGNEDISFVFDFNLLVDDNNDTWNLIEQLLRSREHEFWFHNQSFDLQVIYHWFEIHWSELGNGEPKDTMCLALGTTEREVGVGLKALARKWLNAPYYEAPLRQYLKFKTTPYSAIPRHILAEYAAADTTYTARLIPILDEIVTQNGAHDLVYDLLMPAQRCFADMEYAGVKVDRQMIGELRREWFPRIKEIEDRFHEFIEERGWTGGRVNMSSSDQLRPILFDLLHMVAPPIRRKVILERMAEGKAPPADPTGKEFRKLDANLKHRNSGIITILEEYAEAQKMMRTYVDGMEKRIRPDTGRIHPSFAIGGTRSGRLAIRNPAMQTIPRKSTSPQFGNVRRMFIADRIDDVDPEGEGVIFLAADYAQLELRIAWLLSADLMMGKMIRAGDFHTDVARQVFGIPADQPVPFLDRHNTKYVTYGVMYGRTPYSLHLEELKHFKTGKLSEVEEFYDNWFDTFSTFGAWFDENKLRALRDGYLTTPFGRTRRWPIKTRDNKKDIENEASSFLPQSTATDITLGALIRIHNTFRKEKLGRVLFTIHDSLEAEVYASTARRAADVIEREMCWLPPQLQPYADRIAELDPANPFELEIELGAGYDWAGAEEDVLRFGSSHEEHDQPAEYNYRPAGVR
jgi:uracil-DNA glycosylase family 4